MDDGRRHPGSVDAVADQAQGRLEGGRARGRAQDDCLGDYYSFPGDYAQQVVQSAPKDANTVKGSLSAFEQAGADELICFPASSDPAQVELLAEAAGL